MVQLSRTHAAQDVEAPAHRARRRFLLPLIAAWAGALLWTGAVCSEPIANPKLVPTPPIQAGVQKTLRKQDEGPRPNAVSPPSSSAEADEPDDEAPPDAEPAGEESMEGENSAEMEGDGDAEGSDEDGDDAEGTTAGWWFDLILRPFGVGNRRATFIARDANALLGQGRKSRHPNDPRAPYDRTRGQMYRHATQMIRDGQWKDAIKLLQEISDHREDSLYFTNDGRWVPLRAEVQKIREQAPREVTDLYRQQFGELAQRLLSEAQGRQGVLGSVASGYTPTDAGYLALDQLGSLHLDRGEYELAARCFDQLWRVQWGAARSPVWRLKAAVAYDQAGQTDKSLTIIKELPDPLDIGGQRRPLADWMRRLAPNVVSRSELVREWTMPFGAPSRHAISAGGEPLLLLRWHQTSTHSNPIQTQLQHLTDDLTDQGSPPLPLAQPLLIGGKVIARTLHGVVVMDAESGKPLWQTDELVPVETIFSQQQAAEVGVANRAMAIRINGVQMNTSFAAYNGGAADYHPLTNICFRNANHNLLSSDGRQLFVLEDPTILSPRPPGQMWGWDGGGVEGKFKANKLVSYDLQSGRPLWEAGGEAFGDGSDLPLAGYFFFGPPVPDGEDLLIIGELDDEIRLLALDPATGRPRWSQLVGASLAKIDIDLGRRWWSSQIAVSRGIVVCPTNVGWLVALDKSSRNLLWGHRYLPPPAHDASDPNLLVQATPVLGRWSPTPPVIAGRHVVAAPIDSQAIFCLDLFTGKRLWQHPRGDNLYLAGVFDEQVVLVGRHQVTGYNLTTGIRNWKVEIPAPVGHGVAVAGRYYVPLATNEVACIDLVSGEIVQRLTAQTALESLGNLSMYRGMLVSVNALGVAAFEQKDSLLAEIAAREQRDPRDAWALLRRADVLRLNQDLRGAQAALQKIDVAHLSSPLRDSFRRSLLEVVSALVRQDFMAEDVDRNLDELRRWSQTVEEQLQYRRLSAERFIARGDAFRAFQACLELADASPSAPLTIDREGKLSARLDVWLGGMLEDLWRKLSVDQQAELEPEVTRRRNAALDGSPAELRGHLRLFGYHPSSPALKLELADRLAREGEFLAAEQVYNNLRRGADVAAAAQATERLAALLMMQGQPADAAVFYQELKERYADIALSDGRCAVDYVDHLAALGKLPSAARRAPATSTLGNKLRIVRIGVSYTNTSTVDLSHSGSRAPFFRDHQIQVYQSDQRFEHLEVLNAADARIHWSVPLRSRAGTTEGSTALAQSSLHQLMVFHRGVLHSLSPVDRRILWTAVPEGRGASTAQFSGTTLYDPRVMVTAQRLLKSGGWFSGPSGGTSMPAKQGANFPIRASNTDFICFQGARGLTVYDTVTGEVRWSLTGLKPGAAVYGSEDLILVRPSENDGFNAYRAADGKLLPVAGLNDLLKRACLLDGRRLVVIEPAESVKNRARFRCVDLLTGQDAWTHEVRRGTFVSLLDDKQFLLLTAGGEFLRLRVDSGAVDTLAENIGDAPRHEIYTLADFENIYLLLNAPPDSNTMYTEHFSYVRASGKIMAFDPTTPRLRWQRTISGQHLVLERLDHAPALVFVCRRMEERFKIWMLRILVLDKFTGETLLDDNSPSQTGFRNLVVSLAERFIELQAYNERLRIMPLEGRPNATPP